VRRRHPLLLGSALALLGAAPAAAAELQVQGIGTSWTTPDVRIAAGDTVIWTFPNPEEIHNVQADVEPGTASWTYSTQAQKPAVNGSYKFDAPGYYRFICFVHGKGMSGSVTVGDAPPPPPPPLSEQPFPNDSAITTSQFETGSLDTTRPTLRGVTAKRAGKRVKVSFKVSEQSVVTVRLSRGGKTVKTKKASTASRGSLTVGGLKRGRYAVKVTATDVAGNASRSRSASFRIR
jgi:plastocyanin